MHIQLTHNITQNCNFAKIGQHNGMKINYEKNSQKSRALVIVHSIARLLTCKLQWQSTHMCVRMLTVCVCVCVCVMCV